MRKRYKLLFIIFISFLLAIIIYYSCHQNNYMYFAIGDNLSYNNFSTYNYIEYINSLSTNKNYSYRRYNPSYFKVNTLIENIKQDTDSINYYLKNANLITICLGTEELYNYNDLNDEILLEYLNNIYVLLHELRHLNSNKIVIINVYDDNYKFVNKKIKNYAKQNNITYIDYEDINIRNIYRINSKSYLSYKGHKKLADLILNS